jgi:hypothetical protein
MYFDFCLAFSFTYERIARAGVLDGSLRLLFVCVSGIGHGAGLIGVYTGLWSCMVLGTGWVDHSGHLAPGWTGGVCGRDTIPLVMTVFIAHFAPDVGTSPVLFESNKGMFPL